jgi:FMN reductase
MSSPLIVGIGGSTRPGSSSERVLRAYLDGRAVGCIACAAGWQAANTTLSALRAVVHALRGWPTPVGVAINTADVVWEPSGMPQDPQLQMQLQLLVGQVLGFVRRWDGEAVA